MGESSYLAVKLSVTLAGKYNAIESEILVVVLNFAVTPCNDAEFLSDSSKSAPPVARLRPVALLYFHFSLANADCVPTVPGLIGP